LEDAAHRCSMETQILTQFNGSHLMAAAGKFHEDRQCFFDRACLWSLMSHGFLVSLVYLVSLVSLVKLQKVKKREKPDELHYAHFYPA
jgi:hypothetical protein